MFVSVCLNNNTFSVKLFVDRDNYCPETTPQIYICRFSFDFMIRIPALMYVQIGKGDKDVGDTADNVKSYDYFVKDQHQITEYTRDPPRSYRKQCGVHVFVEGTKIQPFLPQSQPREFGQLLVLATSWRSVHNTDTDQWSWRYSIDTNAFERKAPVTCVYPSVTSNEDLSLANMTRTYEDRLAVQNPQSPIIENSQLLLGLLFCSQRTEDFCYYTRTYERNNNYMRSHTVSDITEDFIRPFSPYSEGLRYWQNDLFPISQAKEAVALYVCNGARLMVFDRYTEQWNYVEPPTPPHQPKAPGQPPPPDELQSVDGHCRSLFQQGSLVVVSDCYFRLDMEIIYERKSGEINTVFRNNWNKKDDQNEILPDVYHKTLNDEDREGFSQEEISLLTKDTFSGLRKKVLFIGANDSEHNSICWKLEVEPHEIYQNEIDPPKYLARLTVPEGGRLLDVTSWEQGFQQIYSRHRYEQLHRSVVYANASQPINVLDFQTPANLMIERILGIGYSHPMSVPYPTPVPNGYPPIPTDDWQIEYSQGKSFIDQRDCDVRRYIDYSRYNLPQVAQHHRGKGYQRWKWALGRNIEYQVPPPPAFPPILIGTGPQDLQLKYILALRTDTTVQIKQEGPLCEFGWYRSTPPEFQASSQQKFRLVYEEVPEYNWKYCVVGDESKYDFSKRLGNDFYYYEKVGDQQIGRVMMWCFKEIIPTNQG